MDTVLKLNDYEKKELKVQRGDIFFADVPITKEETSLQKGKRPILIVSAKPTNDTSKFCNYIALTSKMNKTSLPTHIIIGVSSGLRMDSTALTEQVMSIDKSDLLFRVGHCDESIMKNINKALVRQLGLEC